MRWERGRRSNRIEDRRNSPLSRGLAGGGLGGIVLLLIALYFGIDPGLLLDGSTPQQQAQPLDPEQTEQKDFVAVVLADTEDTWHAIFQAMGSRYREPTLVLFSGAVRSGCGLAGAEAGPFYCPADEKVYLDLRFFEALERRFGAPGDFARAYVIAHEVGHHVQTRYDRNYRQTALLASGPSTPIAPAIYWKQATSKRAWRQPARSAMTRYSSRRRTRFSRKHSPMAAQPSGCAGSAAGGAAATPPTATPLRPGTCKSLRTPRLAESPRPAPADRSRC